MPPASPVVIYGTRSPQADAHRHSSENLLSRKADRWDHTRPRHPYAPPLFRDSPPRSRSRRPDDPDAAGPSVARHHPTVPPDHPAASGDDPQPVRPPALRGPTPAPRRSRPMPPHATDGHGGAAMRQPRAPP